MTYAQYLLLSIVLIALDLLESDEGALDSPGLGHPSLGVLCRGLLRRPFLGFDQMRRLYVGVCRRIERKMGWDVVASGLIAENAETMLLCWKREVGYSEWKGLLPPGSAMSPSHVLECEISQRLPVRV